MKTSIFKLLIFYSFFLLTIVYADGTSNNSCDGELISELNNVSTSITHTESGTVKDSNRNNDKDDYYYFNITTSGTISLSYTSNRDTDLRFSNNSCNDNKILNNGRSASESLNVVDGDKIYIRVKAEKSRSTSYSIDLTFTPENTSSNVSNSTSDICYEPLVQTGLNMGLVSFMNKTQMPIKNLNNQTISNVKVAVGTTSAFSAFGDCGVEDGTGDCEDASGKSFMAFSAFNEGVNFNLEDLSQNEGITPYTESVFSFLNSNDYDLVTSYVKDGVTHEGLIHACPVSYCETNNLSEGFNVVDPDGGEKDNSFEIFCHKEKNIWHDLLALPIKNNSNNFAFKNETTTDNYYDTANNPRTHFNAVEIDGGHITYSDKQPNIPVVVARSDEPWDIKTDDKDYKVMGSIFSNINLIGTPFTIEWDKTSELEGCNESKLRKALGQAVKYNTGNEGTSNDSKSRCSINTMQLSLLDDYRFLVYDNEEVLQHSCKEMAHYVPSNVGVLDQDVAGHFNILTTEQAYPDSIPATNGSRNKSTDIGESIIDRTTGSPGRPITVYCKYQGAPLNYVWTFLTALDAQRTQYKTDLVSKSDTCSQLGLFFYVPNSKETFDRVRKYLKNSKTGDDGWENYTGTIDEKIRSLTSDNQYYLPKFKDVKIWPYGPFGVYLPSGGTTNAPRAPMHNISTLSNYEDSMGKKGWVSILGPQDLNKTTNDTWWISDIGAGLEITKIADGSANDNSTYSPHGDHPRRNDVYDEPNGNYTYNAWYNFLYDDEGWVYHNDDWYDNYPYYDYMCMSETNYDAASRYTLIPGFFNAIERNTRAGNTSPEFSDTNLTTQIVSRNINLDILLYKLNNDGSVDRGHLNTTEDKSVGAFLSTIDTEGNNPPVPIKYLGEFNDFNSNNGRIEIPSFNISSANKSVIVQFYFCNASDQNWTECWDYTSNGNSITLSSLGGGDKYDSVDDFAIRPKRFDMIATTGSVVKAENVTLTYYAYDEVGNASVGYSEPFSKLDMITKIADPSKIPTCANTSLDIEPNTFTDGIETNTTKLGTVGIWNITIKERDGSEFANTDQDDTPDIDRYITPADLNLTILPSYFDVSLNANINKGINFTYLSNDLDNMAIQFDFSVSAKNSDGTVTPNYSVGCYANNINVDLLYSIVSSGMNPAVFADKVIYKELNSGIDGNNTASNNSLSLPKGSDVLPSSLFTTTVKGKADVSLRVNFKRNLNTALNPFQVKFNDLNVSDQTYSPVVTSNNSTHVINKTATMIYGRTNAPRQRFTTNSGTALIYYEAYCNATDSSGTVCNKTILPNSINSISTNDPRWFRNNAHTTTSGDAGSVTQKSANSVTGTTATTTTNPSQTTLNYVDSATKGYPYKATMLNTPSSWLVYDKYDATNTATTNSFEVEFDNGASSWAGAQETNTTTSSDASVKTNRRSMW